MVLISLVLLLSLPSLKYPKRISGGYGVRERGFRGELYLLEPSGRKFLPTINSSGQKR